MQPPTKEEELQAACLQAARSAMWEQRPVDVDDIRRVAESFYALAKASMSDLEQSGGKGDFVVRAVRYLANTHAIPPMRDDVHWFGDMLHVLVELASPSSLPSPYDALFYRDLLQALANSLAAISAPEEQDGSHRER